jgi:hypothetical protein
MNIPISIIAVFAMLFFSNCNNYAKSSASSEDDYHCYEWTNAFPIMDSAGGVQEIGNTAIRFIEKGNVVAYELPYTFDSLHNNVHIFREKRVYYLVYSKDSSYGWAYDENRSRINNHRLLVDSVIGRQFPRTLRSLINDSTRRILSSRNTKDTLFETYEGGIKNSPTQAPYTAKFFYVDKLKNVSHSLSPVLDQQKNSKLVKFIIDIAPFYSDENKVMVSGMQLTQQIRSIDCQEQGALIGYLNKYLKQKQ